jgi:uncharacterized protein YeaO (DUF488 family)
MPKPSKNTLRLKRAYAAPADGDGTRVLVDRLWPRGVSRETGRIDLWLKDLAPSDDLRHRFHANRDLWNEFRTAYRGELARTPAKEAVAELRALAAKETVTLLFASQDEERNNAVVLAEYLSMKSRRAAPAARRRKSTATAARGRTSA